MILDMVFEPRTAAAIEIEKLAFPVWSADHEHSLVMQTAFSGKTIGQNPLKAGDQAHINASVVNDFMAQRLTPENCLLVGSGIQNHSEFVQMVKQYLPPFQHFSGPARTPALYTGGSHLELRADLQETTLQLAWKSVPVSDQSCVVFFVIETLIGQCSVFSEGGPGKGMHTRAVDVMCSNPNVSSLACKSHMFSDSGLFQIDVQGTNSPRMLRTIIKLLHELRGERRIEDEELVRAKNCTKMKILQSLEHQ